MTSKKNLSKAEERNKGDRQEKKEAEKMKVIVKLKPQAASCKQKDKCSNTQSMHTYIYWRLTLLGWSLKLVLEAG